ncbi:MAG: hypothetical protein JW928_05805, partial [Candidatus Aureabacteria bacterium]|nr:hypothetical protein [Candidatus Auribacterota bacterium]
MKNDKNASFIRKHRVTLELLAFMIFLMIFNFFIPYPLPFKKFLYIPESEIGNNFLLYRFRATHEKSPVSFDVLTRSLHIASPEKNSKNDFDEPFSVSLSLPDGFLSARLTLLEHKTRGNNYFLSLDFLFRNGSLYKSPFGTGWETGYDKKIVQKNDRYYVFSASQLRQIFCMDKTGNLAPVFPGEAVLRSRDGQLWYREPGSLLEIYHPVGGGVHVLSRIEDDYGNFLALNYSQDMLLSVEESTGRIIYFSYDKNRHIIKAELSGGAAYYFSYDAIGNLVKIDDENSTLMAFKYESFRNAHYLTDIIKKNLSLKFYFDFLGRTTDIQAKQDSTHLDYERNRVRLTRNGSLAMDIFTPQERNLLISLPDTEKVLVNYNDQGNVTFYKDESEEVHYDYDKSGYLVRSSSSLGTAEEYSYEDKPSHRLVKKTVNDRTVFEALYDKDADVLTIDGSRQYKISYDEFGNITAIDKNGNPYVTLKNNEFGNVLKATYTDESQTIFFYSADQKLQSFIDRFSNQYKVVYGQDGFLDSIIGPNGQSISADGSMTKDDKVEEPEEIFTSSGNISHIDFLKNEITLDYELCLPASLVLNELRQIKTLSFGDGYRIDMKYDAKGFLDVITDSEGKGVFFKKDKNERIAKMLFLKNDPVFMTRNAKGKISKVLNGKREKQIFYNAAGQVESMSHGNIVTRYAYDGNKLSSITYPDRTRASFTYGSNGYLKAVHYEKIEFAKAAYDKQSRSVRMNFFNGIEEILNFDQLRRLEFQKIIKNASPLISLAYRRNGDNIQFIEKNGRRLMYTYDGNNNLVRLSLPDGTAAEYEYDSQNNVASFSYNNQKITFQNAMIDNRRTVLCRDSSKTISLSSINLYGRILGEGIDFIEVNNTPAKIKDHGFLVEKFPVEAQPESLYSLDGIELFKKTFHLKSYTKAGERASSSFTVNFVPDYSTVVRFRDAPLIDSIASEGRMTRIQYDSFNRIRELDAGGGDSSHAFSYNLNGTVSTMQSDGIESVFVYDIYNNLIAVTDTLGNARYKIIYDYSRNIPIGFIDSSNKLYTMHLDHNGSTFAVFGSDGEEVCGYVYGPFGNILKKKEDVPPPLYFRSFYWLKNLKMYIDKDKFFSS